MAIDAERLQKPVRKLRKLLSKMPSQPSPEEVHDLRTNSRRIEAMLPALSLDSKRQDRRMLRRVSKLRKRAGKVRDFDVFTGYLSKIPNHRDKNACSVQLLEYLGAERQKYAKKLNRVRRQNGSPLRKELKQTEKQLAKTASQDGQPSPDANSASSDAASNALHLLTELSAPRRLGRGNLHPFRLKVKELRSLLQMAGDSSQQDFLDRLDEVKDAIGEWHDWAELEAIARKVLTHGAQCPVLREIRKTADAKYEQALEKSQQLRKKFLRVSEGSRSRSRPKLSQGPTEPVWSATAALAA
jgi:CHAD domain-containing protein